jgi:hypothetical protein
MKTHNILTQKKEENSLCVHVLLKKTTIVGLTVKKYKSLSNHQNIPYSTKIYAFVILPRLYMKCSCLLQPAMLDTILSI